VKTTAPRLVFYYGVIFYIKLN
jgi:hypothetical protein